MSADGDGTNGAPADSGNVITLPRTITVRDLGEALNATSVDVIKQLMKRGVMAAINQSVEYEMAASVAEELGFQPRPEDGNGASASGAGSAIAEGEREEEDTNLQPRPPVVTVMGHVDHGKTSLLDAIREANVVATEAGAITQHIGAYQVEVKGHKITFIDTPGHEAFTAMRARGANVTDIAVLVVAADDGVMPQTIEAIAHAKAAGVPIIMAINKIDLPAAEPDRVKQQLTQHDIVIEEYGGDVPAIPVSAKTKQGLDDLLEHIQLVAEISELKANPDRPAEGTVIEAEKDPNRGPMATVIVERGTLRISDPVIAGESWGKVKAMFDDKGGRLTEATPSTPVEVMGLESVPKAGDSIVVVEDERTGREVAEERRYQAADAGQQRVTLEAISGDIAAGRTKDLNIVIKADVQGSVEAIRSSLERLAQPEVRVNIIHTGTGAVSESDAMLATASKAVVVAFNVKAEPGAKRMAENEGIDLRNYKIIYELIEDVDRAVKGLIEPVTVEIIDGHAEVKAIFRVRGGRIAGCAITDGVVRRNSLVRLMREGELIHTSRVSSLKRFQEDVREVTEGLECGIGVERFERFQEGDVIEAYHTEQKG
jgi:translation initiation factor IF-2